MIASASEAIIQLQSVLPKGAECAVFHEPYEFEVRVEPGDLVAVLNLLKQDAELNLTWYSQAFGIDRGESIEVVHHLQSVTNRLEAFVRVQLDKSAPVCPSAVEVFAGANWHEREIFDMFGVEFEGHPDLRVILLPEGFVGHPLLKDWKPVL